MKIPRFEYHRPESLDEVLVLLAEHGDDAKILAGGQSLLPMMALRLAAPAHLVDIGRVRGFGTVSLGDSREVTLGALVRQATAERSLDIAQHAPLVHDAAPQVAHRAIRTVGTVCGSIAHADPAAEMPAVALAAGATMVAKSTSGTREIAADHFFLGYLDTALRPDELLAEVRFPVWPATATGAVVEVSRRHGDYALVGLACRVEIDGPVITDAALAFFGVGTTPVRVAEAERGLAGQPPSDDVFAEAANVVSASLTPGEDIHASTGYRRHLAGVLTGRALTRATTGIGGRT
ncbi:MAG: FAD binding domain-containing protein [Pseudonocardiaceae bacterium]